jgi:hypothetical protein
MGDNAMMRGTLTYEMLVSNYGRDSALYILKSIERMAEIEAGVSGDGETRLKSALEILYAPSTATKH